MTTATTTKSATKSRVKSRKRSQSITVPCYEFPAVYGIQAKREYYVAMIPIKLLSKLFVFNDEELPADMRAQRQLNPRRTKAIRQYVLKSDRYTLSSLTVTFDIDKHPHTFKPMIEGSDAGLLKIPMTARFYICDGQHRAEGLKQASREDSELADESISVVLYPDTGLQTNQQRFHDLNHYAAKPSKSINLLYDHRNPEAQVVREVRKKVPFLNTLTDCEKTSLTKTSSKLFTLNALQEATDTLLAEHPQLDHKAKVNIAIEFWIAMYSQMKDWQMAHDKSVAPGEIRQNCLSGHAVTLVALGCLGQALVNSDHWKTKLQTLQLDTVDWSKSNPAWENLVIFGGRIHKNKINCAALATWLWENRPQK